VGATERCDPLRSPHADTYLHEPCGIEPELAADIPNNIGDRVHFQQVIANLVMYAIEAMSGVTVRRGRRLLIRSERRTDPT
jgi:hypothetical protein